MRLSPIVIVSAVALSAALAGCGKGSDSGAAPAGSGAEKKEPLIKMPEIIAGYTFKLRKAAVGDKSTSAEVGTFTSKVTIEAPVKKVMDDSEVDAQEWNDEVLAVENNVITKVKVTFTKMEKTKSGKKGIPSPIAGHTYIIEAKAGVLTVMDDKGKPANPIQAKIAKSEYHWLGKPNALHAALPPGGMKVGDKLNNFAAVLPYFIDNEDDKNPPQFSDATATLASVTEVGGKKIAIFDVAFKLTDKEDMVTVTGDMKGQMGVGLDDGLPASVKLDGPLVLTFEKKPTDKTVVSGAGTFGMTGTYTH